VQAIDSLVDPDNIVLQGVGVDMLAKTNGYDMANMMFIMGKALLKHKLHIGS
jgi:hypothetical protein